MANLEGIRVTIYKQIGVGDDLEWDYVTSTTTEADGTYSLSGLSAGTYRLKFNDPTGAYLTEYFDNAASLDVATNIVVTAAQTVTGKDAVLGSSAFVEGTVTDV